MGMRGKIFFSIDMKLGYFPIDLSFLQRKEPLLDDSCEEFGKYNGKRSLLRDYCRAFFFEGRVIETCRSLN